MSLEMQRNLGERELQIFNAEMQRQQRNVLVSYVLWFFVGWAGAHKFYLGQTLRGLIYLVLGIGGWSMVVFGFGMAMADSTMVQAGGETSAMGIVMFAAWGLLMLWDLVTLPRQHTKRDQKLQMKLLNELSK